MQLEHSNICHVHLMSPKHDFSVTNYLRNDHLYEVAKKQTDHYAKSFSHLLEINSFH